VLNSETNKNLVGAIVTMGGIQYSTPLIKSFARGTVLTLTAYKLGFTTETRTINVEETNGRLIQRVMFLMSADLVKKVALCEKILLCLSIFFLTFLNENSMFLGIFKANSMFLPPLENFALPWKKVCGRPCLGCLSLQEKLFYKI